MRRHCADEGRDYDAIEKTCAYHVNADATGGLADDLTGGLLGLAASGIQTAIGIVRGPEPVRTIERLGREVIPAIAGA